MTLSYDVCVNGTWLSAIGASLQERQLPILPRIEEQEMKIAGTDGEWNFGSTYGSRLIELTFYITVPPAQFHQTLTRLAHIFNAERREFTLVFSDIPDRKYYAVNNGTLALDDQAGSRLVIISLKAHNPWAESGEQITDTTITRSPEVLRTEVFGGVHTPPILTLTNTGTTTIRKLWFSHEYTIGQSN